MFWGVTASLLLFLGVGLGAFAAHGLERRRDPRSVEIFETGVRYHLIHALVLHRALLAEGGPAEDTAHLSFRIADEALASLPRPVLATLRRAMTSRGLHSGGRHGVGHRRR